MKNMHSSRSASGAQPHPTKLVQSAAMASVAPKPSYRPMLPANIVADGLLSDAQLIIYAGEAHDEFLAGSWTVDETFDLVSAAPEGAEGAVRFRRGFMLGDGTAGKGRQSAGIILDNWLRGRRKAVWIQVRQAWRTPSATSRRSAWSDFWSPLSRFPQGKPITLPEGILFTTYATLRSDDRGEKVSRVRQIVDWLGSDFDGVIFDESHAMQNAAAARERAMSPLAAGTCGPAPSARLPPRVVYVSATGATTVHNLAYAQRLGLWGGRISPSQPAPSSSPPSRTAASRRWRCSPAISGRSASMRPGRSPMTAWNMSWSSTPDRRATAHL
jgi:hypothetical protein